MLLVLFGGVLLGVLLRGVADLLSDHSRLSSRASLVLVTSIFFIALGCAVWLLIMQVAEQLDQLGGNLTQSLARVQAQLEQQAWGRQLLALLSQAPSSSGQDMSVASRMARALSTTLGGVVNVFVILLIGVYLTPLIEQRSVELPPALTIAMQLLLGVLIGPLGVVFATPLAAVSVVLIQHLYVEEVVEQGTSGHHAANAQPADRKRGPRRAAE